MYGLSGEGKEQRLVLTRRRLSKNPDNLANVICEWSLNERNALYRCSEGMAGPKEVRHTVRAISIPQKSDETAIMLIPPHDFPRIEGGSGSESGRKEGRWNGTTSGVEEEVVVVRKTSSFPLSLHPESPFIEEEETTAHDQKRGIGNQRGESAPLRWSIGVPVARARAKKRAVATDADNNNAWETAECEKNEQGGTAEVIRRFSIS